MWAEEAPNRECGVLDATAGDMSIGWETVVR